MEGVEPTRLAALDPKSSASANFATSAGSAKVGVLTFPTKRLREQLFILHQHVLMHTWEVVLEPWPKNLFLQLLIVTNSSNS